MQPSPVQIRQPGKAGLWVGAILLVVGIFGGFGLILVGALDIVRGLVDAPGVAIGESEELQLSAQRYELYLFSEGGGTLPTSNPTVTVSPSGGDEVAVGPPTPGADAGSSAFRSIGTFTIDEAGTYDVAVADIDGTSSAVTVRVGQDFNSLVESSGVWILAGLVVGATGFVVGLIVLIITVRRRSNARRAGQAAWAGYAATPPGYPTMGQPPAWGPPPTMSPPMPPQAAPPVAPEPPPAVAPAAPVEPAAPTPAGAPEAVPGPAAPAAAPEAADPPPAEPSHEAGPRDPFGR